MTNIELTTRTVETVQAQTAAIPSMLEELAALFTTDGSRWLPDPTTPPPAGSNPPAMTTD